MPNYKLDISWFLTNGNDTVTFSSGKSATITATTNLSAKVLRQLYNMDKPYILDLDAVVVEKPKKKKKSKTKIDEPKEEKEITEEFTENNEEQES